MEYHEAVNRLERLRRLRPKLGTETTAALLEHLGDPHEGLDCVQVAGSNGKGSTARVLDRILRETGREVGCYTSPDLNDLRERATVSGQPIPKSAVVRFVEEAWPFVVDRGVEGDAPTFFEAITAMALWHFGREDVDVAILEVGIGGRYDATSVVDPVASAVTSVSLEHTDIIGETVEEIARDKATVASADGPLVTGATGSALDTIRESSDVITVGGPSREAPTDITAEETGMVTLTESELSLAGEGWEVQTETPLLGQHQAVNAGIAATLARQVGARTDGSPVTDSAVAAGIRNVSWPGRFEVMDREPLTVLDGAHNPAACATLGTVLDRFDYDDLHLVFGAMRDKDHREMCRALPAADRAFLAEPDVERALDTETLAAVFERTVDADVEQSSSVLDAVGQALRVADSGDCVLVTGSLYTVAAARDRWTRTPTVVRTDTPERARAAMETADVPAATRRRRADRLVGETVRFHARRGVAEAIQERMLELGGSCAVSGVEAADGHVHVVLSGTRDQFLALVRECRGRAGESRHIAAQLNDALGVGVGADESGDYPWHDGTAVMGIVNVTPDSFHDGGEYNATDEAVARAREQVDNGAAIVDIGGESTRPGADPVSAAEERERVVPVIAELADTGLDAMVSVDTRKPTVAAAALDAGADIVNDVTGLADASMRRVVAEHGVPAVCMHSLSAPVDPTQQYDYGDVVSDVMDALTERVLLAERAGIDRSDLLIDPGLGFGKRAGESFELLDRLAEFRALGCPVMVGHSHKSMFREVATDPEDRFAATVAGTALAADRGADVVRVHDVPENVDAVATAVHTTDGS
jgi:dihydropteroate synthase